MDKVRQQYIEINKRIFNHRDGQLHEIQQEYGTVYKKSLGVPIVSLQNIAADYKCSHELAKLLWEFGGREQTIIAAILEEPEKVEVGQLELYLLQAHTPELWEQITRQLLRRLPQIADFVNNWLERKNEVLHVFAILSLGYLPKMFSAELLQKMMSIELKQGGYLQKCLQRVILKIGIRDKEAFEIMRKNIKMRSCYAYILDEVSNFYK